MVYSRTIGRSWTSFAVQKDCARCCDWRGVAIDRSLLGSFTCHGTALTFPTPAGTPRPTNSPITHYPGELLLGVRAVERYIARRFHSALHTHPPQWNNDQPRPHPPSNSASAWRRFWCRAASQPRTSRGLWRDSYSALARLYDLTIVGVSNVGPMTSGPWAGRKCIGCSLAVGPSGDVLLQGPYGEAAEALLNVEVTLRAPIARGSQVAAALASRGYAGP